MCVEVGSTVPLEQHQAMHPALNDALRFARLAQRAFLDDVAILVADRTRIWAVVPARTFALTVTEGYELRPGDGLYEAVREGRVREVRLDASVLGLPVVIKAVPIAAEGGEPVGAFCACTRVDAKERLVGLATTLSSSVQQTSATLQEMAASMQVLATSLGDIARESRSVLTAVRDVRSISDEVREIADTSRILGLNASIEASRAGESGRGFAVIAREIRRLAEGAREQTDVIAQNTRRMVEMLEALNEAIERVDREAEAQRSAMEALASAMQEVSQVAVDLVAFAEQTARAGAGG
ncbi:methyl-accepting chemotaxis protein [Alicyclobacillus acidocaldarius]|uniref:Methyl-accepting chemotaxis sensory transducer n=1 Tax=Alicyclobacillus acidocaldarius (strain Tc-4-1) TaxID=1048834 RepID=F8IJI2_ALIAT|nr:methyl-accepting chemotaxis sensory transducer [Alicyclobacillus acidocaldarius subsp. acidocaldarius Tc-4-1]